jgi:hypothetical protein
MSTIIVEPPQNFGENRATVIQDQEVVMKKLLFSVLTLCVSLGLAFAAAKPISPRPHVRDRDLRTEESSRGLPDDLSKVRDEFNAANKTNYT